MNRHLQVLHGYKNRVPYEHIRTEEHQHLDYYVHRIYRNTEIDRSVRSTSRKLDVLTLILTLSVEYRRLSCIEGLGLVLSQKRSEILSVLKSPQNEALYLKIAFRE